jgi:hypothetical protein
VRQLTLNEEIQRPAQAIGKLVSVENANCLLARTGRARGSLV